MDLQLRLRLPASLAVVGSGLSALALFLARLDGEELSMDLIILILVVVLIGFIVWVLTTRVPMPPMWATAIQVVALIVILLYVLSRFVNLPNVLPR